MQIVGRTRALTVLHEAAGDRFALYGLENRDGATVYVHAMACVIDDTRTCVGSDNLNLRSWTHDSELSCAVVDDTPRHGGGFGLRPRLTLAREHLDRTDDTDLRDPATAFTAFRAAAQQPDAWYAIGQHGPRPPGDFAPTNCPPCPHATRCWPDPCTASPPTPTAARPRFAARISSDLAVRPQVHRKVTAVSGRRGLGGHVCAMAREIFCLPPVSYRTPASTQLVGHIELGAPREDVDSAAGEDWLWRTFRDRQCVIMSRARLAGA